MKTVLYNAIYFLKEIKTIIRLNLLSHIFSLFSTSLILFILSMVISGWWIGGHVLDILQGEAEVSVYFYKGLEDKKVLQLVEDIQRIKGVRKAHIVTEEEAYVRMEEILGKEARVLEYFEDNPFTAFIEVNIHLEEMNAVLEELGYVIGIEYIRDNREILERLHSISQIFYVLGYFVLAAVGLSTVVMISHMIRLGIYHNREQIHTLRLLGASEVFIGFPYVLEGILLTLVGGGLAVGLAAVALKQMFLQMAGPLPFIPLPPQEEILRSIAITVISLSTLLGTMGSLFGLSSAKGD